MAKITAKIESIGTDAIDEADKMIILFDQSATNTLKNVAVIQHFNDQKVQKQLQLKIGDQIALGKAIYTIQKVGALVNDNLKSIGHATLIFSTPPTTNALENGIYVQSVDGAPAYALVSTGMTITYNMQ